ncbi:hypothetical protein BC628DRAFT_1363241 [Trametes gibbosa]|nr:hypothetical protein BC628DRAFT_1363241 [Trametes gibbosa]
MPIPDTDPGLSPTHRLSPVSSPSVTLLLPRPSQQIATLPCCSSRSPLPPLPAICRAHLLRALRGRAPVHHHMSCRLRSTPPAHHHTRASRKINRMRCCPAAFSSRTRTHTLALASASTSWQPASLPGLAVHSGDQAHCTGFAPPPFPCRGPTERQTQPAAHHPRIIDHPQRITPRHVTLPYDPRQNPHRPARAKTNRRALSGLLALCRRRPFTSSRPLPEPVLETARTAPPRPY